MENVYRDKYVVKHCSWISFLNDSPYEYFPSEDFPYEYFLKYFFLENGGVVTFQFCLGAWQGYPLKN